jgi:hypothetical protein
MEPTVSTSLLVDSDVGPTNNDPHAQHNFDSVGDDPEEGIDTLDWLISTDPDHIGVSEDPPLCRNCKKALCKPQVLGEVTEIAGMVERVKASAFLGCYLCSVMYNGDWMPLGSTDPSRGGKLSDLEPPPDLFECSLFQIGDQKEKGSLHVRVTAVTFPEGTEKERRWYLTTIPLFPEDSKGTKSSLVSFLFPCVAWIDRYNCAHNHLV